MKFPEYITPEERKKLTPEQRAMRDKQLLECYLEMSGDEAPPRSKGWTDRQYACELNWLLKTGS